MTDIGKYLAHYRGTLEKTIASVDLAKVKQAVEWFVEARRDDRQIFSCGNGGSALTASHMVTDVLKGASFERDKRFRVVPLTDSVGVITAYANDVGYEFVFAEQLKNHARKGDLVVALSGSGNSPSVLRAVEYANSIGCRTIGLTGRDGGKLGRLAQLEIRVADTHMGRIEDAHLIVCHMIAYYFMDRADE